MVRSDDLFARAAALPPVEREELAMRLLDSVAESMATRGPGVCDSLAADLDGRLEEIAKDPSQLLDWEQVERGLLEDDQ